MHSLIYSYTSYTYYILMLYVYTIQDGVQVQLRNDQGLLAGAPFTRPPSEMTLAEPVKKVYIYSVYVLILNTCTTHMHRISHLSMCYTDMYIYYTYNVYRLRYKC